MRRAALPLALLLLPSCLATIDDSLVERPRAAPELKEQPTTPGEQTTPAERAAPLADVEGLVGYWSFDDDRESAVADSTGRHDGQLSGTPARVAGVRGDAIELTGVEVFSVRALDGAAFPASGTLSFHVRARSVFLMERDPVHGLFDVEDATRKHVALFPVSQGSTSMFTTFAPSMQGNPLTCMLRDGLWHWIVITWSETRGELFIDGDSQDVSIHSGFVPSEQRFVFGTRFRGGIDEIALYDRVLPIDGVPQTR